MAGAAHRGLTITFGNPLEFGSIQLAGPGQIESNWYAELVPDYTLCCSRDRNSAPVSLDENGVFRFPFDRRIVILLPPSIS